MSTTPPTIDLPAIPQIDQLALLILQQLAAQSGVATDYNVGSQIRTFSEAIGTIVEQLSTESRSNILQAILLGSWEAFGVVPRNATSASGTLQFTPTSAPTTQQIVPYGTIVANSTAFQYTVIQSPDDPAIYVAAGGLIIPAGSTTPVTGLGEAVATGSITNTTTGTITTLVTGFPFSVAVTNTTPFIGGQNEETPEQTEARFRSVVASIGLGSPPAVVGGALQAFYTNSISGQTEHAQYATIHEPWISDSTAPPGFTVYVDNGTGAASTNLLTAVSTLLAGDELNLTKMGYVPVGVPYSVAAVTPVYVDISVSGTLRDPTDKSLVTQAINTGLSEFMAGLNFGNTLYLTYTTSAVANSVPNLLSSLNVQIWAPATTPVPVDSLAAAGNERIILQTLTVTLS